VQPGKQPNVPQIQVDFGSGSTTPKSADNSVSATNWRNGHYARDPSGARRYYPPTSGRSLLNSSLEDECVQITDLRKTGAGLADRALLGRSISIVSRKLRATLQGRRVSAVSGTGAP